MGGGDWLLRGRCKCGVSVFGEIGVREGVRVYCEVWVLYLVSVLRCVRVAEYVIGC